MESGQCSQNLTEAWTDMSEPKAAVTMSLTGGAKIEDNECAKLVRSEVAAERERCAKIAEENDDRDVIAAAIRRGDAPKT